MVKVKIDQLDVNCNQMALTRTSSSESNGTTATTGPIYRAEKGSR